jgi:hypothetical protein
MSKRNAPDFEALARVVSQESRCPLLLVEKDYWITLILRGLVKNFGNLIVFKGGTSLSKAYKLIDRFSEDVDVLLDDSDTSNSKKRKCISKLRQFLETIPGLTYLPESMQSDDHGNFWLGYDSVFEDEQQKILVEAGFRGGTQPAESLKINSMIGEMLEKQEKSNSEEYTSFQMQVLHLKRTLIEKLFALASAYEAKNLPKKTRHYYDIYCQLKSNDLSQFVESPEFVFLANDIAAHSLKNFGIKQDLNTLLNSHAFNLSDPEYQEITRGYKSDSHLYFVGQPAFELICEAVSSVVKQAC